MTIEHRNSIEYSNTPYNSCCCIYLTNFVFSNKATSPNYIMWYTKNLIHTKFFFEASLFLLKVKETYLIVVLIFAHKKVTLVWIYYFHKKQNILSVLHSFLRQENAKTELEKCIKRCNTKIQKKKKAKKKLKKCQKSIF